MDIDKIKIIINNYIYNLLGSMIFCSLTYSSSYFIYTESDYILVKLIIIFIDILIFIVPILFMYLNKKYKNKEFIFNKSIYNEPNIGDKMVCVKSFFYDKITHTTKSSHMTTTIYKGTVWSVVSIYETYNDWWVGFENEKIDNMIYLYYISESKKILKTKSEIRKDKLKKLKI